MPLTIYPALDILRGHCVRSADEASAQPSLMDEDPVTIAGRWRADGATWLHLIDLDGTLRGGAGNLDLLTRIVAATGLAVQFGGGPQTAADVAAAFEAGAARVIVRAEVAARGALLADCLARWGERIAISVDARDGQLTVAGWLPSASESALDVARRMADAGVRTLILANVSGDGEPGAQRFATLEQARAALPETTLIAAGGFTALEELRRLARLGMDGVVLGRPLYDGALALTEALRVASEPLSDPSSDDTSDTPTV